VKIKKDTRYLQKSDEVCKRNRRYAEVKTRDTKTGLLLPGQRQFYSDFRTLPSPGAELKPIVPCMDSTRSRIPFIRAEGLIPRPLGRMKGIKSSARITPPDLFFLSIAVSLAVCIEGGIIFMALSTGCGYMDCNPSKYQMFLPITRHIPLVVSAILMRIPINFIDKTISVCISWVLMAALQKKFFTGSSRHHEDEN
jgi:hypothetical protein